MNRAARELEAGEGPAYDAWRERMVELGRRLATG